MKASGRNAVAIYGDKKKENIIVTIKSQFRI